MSGITKKEIKHLAELSRLELNDGEIVEIEHDLSEILNHFNELKEVDTEGVKPLTGGADLFNSTRMDELDRTDDTGKGKDQFPEKEDGYLKVPSVFND